MIEGSWIECWEKDKDNLFEFEDKKSIVENQIVFVRAIGEGKLVVGCTEWDATTGEFKTKAHKVFLAKANGIKLAFCETGSADGYWFVRYDFRDNELLDVYLPKFGFFQNAIATEKLAGQVVVRSKDEVGCVIEVKAMIKMLEPEKSAERRFQSSPISVYRRLGQKDGREKGFAPRSLAKEEDEMN